MIAERTELEAEMRRLLAELMALRRRSVCTQPLHREVSLPQLYLLMMLEERGPSPVNVLAGLLGISAPSASALVDRMEEHGLVRRERDVEDRRIVHVTLEERGKHVVDEMTGVKQEQVRRLLDSMPTEDLEAVVRGLQAVHRALKRF